MMSGHVARARGRSEAAPGEHETAELWAHHQELWRDPAQVIGLWDGASEMDPRLLAARTRGRWWETLDEAGITLLVTREYEHLVMAMSVAEGQPSVTYLPLPHPSGLVADRQRGRVHIASTRNPNQVIELAPVAGLMERLDAARDAWDARPLVPIQSRFYAGSLYVHDLALVDGALHANAVGHNAIVRLSDGACAKPVWWPRCIESDCGPLFGRNHLQLNSIAAGGTLQDSYFSASTEKVSHRRPGHRNFPVDRRGVIFSGATREPVARGLTRPHSARLYQGEVWVDNSGYGELGHVVNERYEPVRKLPGWTRGLCFVGDIAFVGTSRVIPRYRQYAPGLDVDASECGLHALDMTTGEVLGSLTWPYGNQIFAIDWLPRRLTGGFPFAGKRSRARETGLFYQFTTTARGAKESNERLQHHAASGKRGTRNHAE